MNPLTTPCLRRSPGRLKSCIAALFLPLFLLIACHCRADVKFVDFKKVDPQGRFSVHQKYLLDNLAYFDHWSPNWVYAIPKESVVGELKSCLAAYGPLQSDLFETDLLLGEIAHYLYNLSEQAYYDTAENYYKKAIGLNDQDCRGYWFLGYHYATSDEIAKGISSFRKAEKLANASTGRDFWQEYAFAAQIGSMPAHARYAIDKFHQMGGNTTLAHIIDSNLRVNTLPSDPDLSYNKRMIWEARKQSASTVFMSRALGIRFETDSSSRLTIQDYGKRMSAVSIEAGMATGPQGNRIGYSYAVVMKVPQDGEKLDDFVTMFTKGGGEKDASFALKGSSFSGLSYTYKTKVMYADRGGARIRYIFIERAEPAYPGLALEDAGKELDGQEPGKMQFYKMGNMRGRMPGRIFYLFMLDTCEDIYAPSWAAFERFLSVMKLD